jgi:hypothetical protein
MVTQRYHSIEDLQNRNIKPSLLEELKKYGWLPR